MERNTNEINKLFLILDTKGAEEAREWENGVVDKQERSLSSSYVFNFKYVNILK